VRGSVVFASGGNAAGSPRARPKKRLGRRGLERGTLAVHGNGHQPPIERKVEELAAVAAPPSLIATLARDLPRSLAARERPHVDLGASRGVRGVGDPPPVWREERVELARLRPHERLWLSLSLKRKDPEVVLRPGIAVVDQEASVGRESAGEARSARHEIHFSA